MDDPFRLTSKSELFDRLLLAQRERDKARKDQRSKVGKRRVALDRFDWLKKRVGLA